RERPGRKPPRRRESYTPKEQWKIKRRITRVLRRAYGQYVAMFKTSRRIAKQYLAATSRAWTSILENSRWGVRLADYAIASLEREHDFLKIYHELYWQYPGFLKMTRGISTRVLESARDMRMMEDALRKSTRDCEIFKKIWTREGQKVALALKANVRYVRLKKKLVSLRQDSERRMQDFEEFFEKVMADKQTLPEEKLIWLLDAEKKTATARAAQEEKEIELAQFYHRTAQALHSPPHYVEELARQVYAHHVLYRIARAKIG
ncbi:MAG TPA: hypothetical protein VI977_00385, partial [archaeon]|nr:hypothetical protein [archaeon]